MKLKEVDSKIDRLQKRYLRNEERQKQLLQENKDIKNKIVVLENLKKKYLEVENEWNQISENDKSQSQ